MLLHVEKPLFHILERSEFYQNSENIEHQTGYIHSSIRRPYGRDCKLRDLVSKCWILYFKEGNDIHKPIVQFISISLAWLISEARLTHSRLP